MKILREASFRSRRVLVLMLADLSSSRPSPTGFTSVSTFALSKKTCGRRAFSFQNRVAVETDRKICPLCGIGSNLPQLKLLRPSTCGLVNPE